MDLFHDFGRHGKASEAASVDAFSSNKTYEIVRSVAGWTGGNCTNGSGCHAIVTLFMRLNIFEAFHATMCIEVELAVKNKLRGALGGGNAPL